MAQLALEDPSELALGYSNLLQDTYAGSVAYAKPGVGGGVLGLGAHYFLQSAQTGYNALGDQTGTFAPYDLAVSAAYARRDDRLLWGGGAKVIRSEIDGVSGVSAALDLGVQALHVSEIGDGPLDVGAALRNVGPPIKVGAESSSLPMELRGGGLWHASPNFSAVLDLVLPVDDDPYASFGLEAGVRQKDWAGFLRAGYNVARSRGIEGLTGVSLGAGLDVSRLRVDYAWVPLGDLGTTNRVALVFRF